MAFRIEHNVVRGELDNRTKGVVRGKIWLEGRAEPITLELKGNAHPDLAGCRLTFSNPGKPFPHQHLDSLETLQSGVTGDMTASRKARVFDVPLEDTSKMLKREEKPPAHIANILYLEWFSESNGRVVIESSNYDVKVSGAAWQMTAEEDEQRAHAVAEAMREFLRNLTDKIDQLQKAQRDYEEPWNEHDYERFLKASDARADKYAELLDKYGDSEQAEETIAHEMGWDGEPELTEEDEAQREQSIEEMNRACEEALNEPEPEPDPHREGIDWIRTKDGELRHPLQHACFESAMKLWHEVKALGLENNPDRDLTDLVSHFQIAGAKLAGALTGIARGEGFSDSAFTVAWLKRGLDHLHKAQAGLEAVATKNILPNDLVTSTRRQLFEIREGILLLMQGLREEPGN